MFLMYVDESGDPGISRSPSPFFVLSGIVVHELQWNEYLERLIAFRKRMRNSFGLLLREEIHSGRFINRPGRAGRIRRNDRLSIIRYFANEVAGMNDLSIINVVVNKSGKGADYDVLEKSWLALIQRFSNTMSNRNFAGPANADERGLVLPDMSDVKRITRVLRKMRRYNPIPNQPAYGTGYRNLTIGNLVEDPYFKDSRHSYFTQVADLAAFLLYQFLVPSKFMRKKHAHNYFKRLDPVLCKVASSTDPYGVVKL